MIKTPLSTMIGGAFWTPCATIIGSTSATFNTIIKSLFANSEQGFAYDSNDLTTLYQDAAGTIPVTTAGQPVGLMLDKSKGLVLGVEKSSYASGFSSLTGIIPVGVSNSLIDGALVATSISTDGNDRTEIPIANLVVGRLYTVEVVVKGNQVNNQVIYNWTVGSVPVIDIKSTDYTKYKFSFIATAASGVARVYAGASVGDAGGVIQVKSLSIKELEGNHAFQSVSASRPILQRNATTGAYYLAFDGVDDFLQTNNIDFTATDKVSLFAGVAKLLDRAQIIVELSSNTNTNSGSFYLVAGSDYGGIGYTSTARGSSNVFADTTARNFTYVAPDVAVLSVKHDISGDLSSMRRNGVIGIKGLGDKGTGNYGNYPLYIGRRGLATLPFNGHIYGLIGIGRLTTDSETITLEKYIAKNTGVTLNV